MTIRNQFITGDLSIEEHREGFLTLLNTYIMDEMGGGVPYEGIRAAKLLAEIEKHPTMRIFFLRFQGEFVAMANTFKNYSTFKGKPLLNIHDLIVLPKNRDKGLGKKLLEEIIQLAKDEGCCRVNLEVREDNLYAQKLYRRLGFNECRPNMLFWEKITG